MTQIVPTLHPVCDGVATEPIERDRDADRINCPRCGRYIVSDTEKDVMLGKAPEQRRSYLEKAKRRANPGEIPFIRNASG